MKNLVKNQKIKVMRNVVYVLFLVFNIASCGDGIDRKIKNDLNKRFEGADKIEIVNIEADSSYVYGAINSEFSIRLFVSQSNLDITRLYLEYEGEKSKNKRILIYNKMDSIYNSTLATMVEFEDRIKYSKAEKVHRVTYTVTVSEKDYNRSDYYYFNQNNGELYHRDVEWGYFLSELDWEKTIDKAFMYRKELSSAKYELFRKY